MNIIPAEEIPTEIEDMPSELMDVFKVCQKMEALCIEETGIGLSAVQVGIPWNLFLIDFAAYLKPPLRFGYFVDCDYKGIGNKVMSNEGCLSLKNEEGGFRRFEVSRFPEVKITGKRLVDNGEKLELQDYEETFTMAVDGIYCAAFQHEIDHQKFILISDIGEEKGSWRIYDAD